jgi:hypothetical protein
LLYSKGGCAGEILDISLVRNNDSFTEARSQEVVSVTLVYLEWYAASEILLIMGNGVFRTKKLSFIQSFHFTKANAHLTRGREKGKPNIKRKKKASHLKQ